MMLPAEKRLWVVECKSVKAGRWLNDRTKLSIDVKDGLAENWHKRALIVGWLVLKRTLVSRRRQRKVVDKGTLFATAMISQGILQGSVQTMGHCGGKDGVH